MPMYVVYPVEPNLLKQILDLLGKPKIVEVSVSVDDERLRDMLKPDEARSITVQYSCEPEAERALTCTGSIMKATSAFPDSLLRESPKSYRPSRHHGT
ncbi:MAG: hypothetical protein ACUX7D_01425 [Candidatus Methanodesulfokora washburnensis]|jgi:hypothetical protein